MSEAVERLLAALDALDAVTEDLEDGDADGGDTFSHSDADAEPSLGWMGHLQAARQFHGNGDDLEDEHDGREPDDDGIGDADGLTEQTTGEPSLGSFDRAINQNAARYWL